MPLLGEFLFGFEVIVMDVLGIDPFLHAYGLENCAALREVEIILSAGASWPVSCRAAPLRPAVFALAVRVKRLSC